MMFGQTDGPYYQIKNCWLTITWNDQFCKLANDINLNTGQHPSYSYGPI